MARDWTQQDTDKLLEVRAGLARVVKAGPYDLRLKKFQRHAHLEVSGQFHLTPKGRSEEPTGFVLTLQSGNEQVQVDIWDLIALARGGASS